MSLLAMAASVIWLAKWQDRTWRAAPRTEHGSLRRNISASGYIPAPKTEQPIDSQSVEPASLYSSEVFPEVPLRPVLPISAQQERFLQRFVEQKKLRYGNGSLSQQQWESLLKNANVTFANVESIFQEAAERPDEQPIAHEILRDAARSAQVFAALEERFGISAVSAKNFAQSGRRTLSDWAVFIEQGGN